MQLVGYLAALGAALMWLPQAVRVVQHRHDHTALAGVSATTYLSAVIFNGLLLTYGVLSSATPVALAGSINLACACVIVTVVLLARRAA